MRHLSCKPPFQGSGALRRAWALLMALCLALPLSSQAPGQSQPRAPREGLQAPPALRVTTRLVQVNVIAQHGDGKPVTDLTKDDFVLYDKGQPQPISFFSVEMSRTPVTPGSVPTEPKNVYSNRLEQKPGVPTAITVILLDSLNTRFADLAYARQQIIKFLGQLHPDDRVALYSLTTQLRVLHDFTSDASSLLRALNRYRTRDSAQVEASEPETADTGDDQLDQFLNGANQRMANFFTINRALTTASALEAIAHHLERLPGRKNLIWVSGSFPFNIGMDDMSQPQNIQEARTFREEIERAAQALNNANLAVYPVDARGLIPPQFATSGPSSRSLARGKAPSMIRMSPPAGNFDTMVILADRTGGRAFYNTNDIYGSIRRAIEDSQVTYVLGYYPTHGEWNGRFRELKVQVKRSGVHLRYRRGYFALPEKAPTLEEANAILREAVSSPLDFTTLGMNIRADAVDVPGARTIKTQVQVDARDVTLEPQEGRWVGELDVTYVQRNSEGKQLAAETQQVNMHLTRETYQRVLKDGLVLDRNLPVAAGATQLRVVARDGTRGSVGSVSIPLDKLFAAKTN
jgi:VWFA-related protein